MYSGHAGFSNFYMEYEFQDIGKTLKCLNTICVDLYICNLYIDSLNMYHSSGDFLLFLPASICT